MFTLLQSSDPTDFCGGGKCKLSVVCLCVSVWVQHAICNLVMTLISNIVFICMHVVPVMDVHLLSVDDSVLAHFDSSHDISVVILSVCGEPQISNNETDGALCHSVSYESVITARGRIVLLSCCLIPVWIVPNH